MPDRNFSADLPASSIRKVVMELNGIGKAARAARYWYTATRAARRPVPPHRDGGLERKGLHEPVS